MPFGINNFILTTNIGLVLFKYFIFVSALSVSPLLSPSSRPLHIVFKAAGAGICGPTGVGPIQPGVSERDSTGPQ